MNWSLFFPVRCKQPGPVQWWLPNSKPSSPRQPPWCSSVPSSATTSRRSSTTTSAANSRNFSPHSPPNPRHRGVPRAHAKSPLHRRAALPQTPRLPGHKTLPRHASLPPRGAQRRNHRCLCFLPVTLSGFLNFIDGLCGLVVGMRGS